MHKLFISKFVASILALLIASSFSPTRAQSGVVSDEDEAAILESLIENEIKGFGSEFGTAQDFLLREHQPRVRGANKETRFFGGDAQQYRNKET